MEMTIEAMIQFFKEDGSQQERILLDMPESEAQRFLNQLNIVELNKMKHSFVSEQVRSYVVKAMNNVSTE